MSQRVLVFSLWRLGDTLVHAPVLAALKARGFEVHVAIQPLAQAAQPLLSQHFTVHTLPETFMGPEVSANMRRWALEMKALGFYASFNPTHKAFSAKLAEEVTPGAVLGLGMPSGRPTLSSPWMRYLNEWGSFAPLSVFHYADAFCQSVESPWENPRFQPSETSLESWEKQKQRHGLRGGQRLVFVQLFTSERKKTYPLPLFEQALLELRQRLNDVQFVFLASPKEEAAATNFAQTIGGAAFPYVCGFDEAYTALGDAALLISGDTSMVHLASLRETPVLLLSLGSSAFRELGPYGNHHRILQTPFPCSPCPHDESCVASMGNQTFPCTQQSLSPAEVAAVACAQLTGSHLDPLSLKAPLYESAEDSLNLMDYARAGGAVGTDACAEVLRNFLLSQLPVSTQNGKKRQGEKVRNFTPNVTKSLQAMATATEAIVMRAQGNSKAWDTALAQAENLFCLSLLTQATARLNEANPKARQDFGQQYEGLLAYVRKTLG